MHTVITQLIKVAVQEKSHVHCMPIYALLDVVFILSEMLAIDLEGEISCRKISNSPKCYDM